MNLESNKIGDYGAQHVAAILRDNMVTHTYSIHVAHIHLLLSTQILNTLNLSSNHIGASGAQQIGDALRNNTVTEMLG